VVTLRTDVAVEAEVQALAARALAAFGRMDVWVNNAGIDAFGSFEDMPTEAIARVIQVNVMGTVHGIKAALPHFRERGSGILINNASMVGVCPSPFHAAYVASKFAVRGLSFSLRQELADQPEIHVCVVSPASIDTPLWQRGGNWSGRQTKALDPVYPAEQTAEAIVDLVRLPQREVFAGGVAWILAEQYAAAPEMTETMVAGHVRASLFTGEPAAKSPNAMFEPEQGNGGVSGGWLSPDQPGIPASDMLTLMAAPGLMAMGPPLYAWKLGCDFVGQLGRQMPAVGGNGASARPGR
jgi:NAD(P)-dependent dehydrogenase (short-subunit alcohol dehydrogenase family)